jgi:hypothetical protein
MRTPNHSDVQVSVAHFDSSKSLNQFDSSRAELVRLAPRTNTAVLHQVSKCLQSPS